MTYSHTRTGLREFATLLAVCLVAVIVTAILGYIDSPEALSIVLDRLF